MNAKVLILASLLASACGLQAITIDECQQMARENYPLIHQYGLISDNSALTISNTKKGWLPQIQLNAQATYQSDVTGFPEELRQMFSQVIHIDGLSKDQYKIALDVNQTIWDGGTMKSETEITKREKEAAEKSVEVELYKIRSTVNDLYFGILLIDETRKQNLLQTELLEKNHARLKTCLENGTAMQCDADAIYAQLLSVRQQNNMLAAVRREYSRSLSLFIGEPTDSIAVDMPAEAALTSTDNRRPELRQFDAQVSLLEARRKKIDSSVMPKLSAFATGFYGNPGLNMFKDMTDPGWSWNYMIGVGLKWNIGGFYTRKNDLRAIKVQLGNVENQRDVFLFNSNIQTRQKQSEIDKNRRLISDDGEIIAVRTRIREAAESKLENGIIDVTDLLQKITDENSAILDRTTHQIELLKSQYELKYIIND